MSRTAEQRAYHREWYRKNRPRIADKDNQRRRERYQNDPEYKLKVNSCNAARRLGISSEQYLQLWKLAKGQCAICGTLVSANKMRLALDHCHTTGKPRGMLCTKCNSGLGQFDDNPKRLRDAADYLERFYLMSVKQER